jgi:AcrR family transcriptional regulator
MGAWPTTNAPIAVAQAQTMPRDPPAVKESVRDRILAAAMAVAKESGAGRLSLDAIARRAGVSKGGLLYHFPKKDALMRALVEHHLAGIDEATREAENHPRQPNAVARAFIVAYRDMAGCQPTRPSGVLAALAENPHLLEPVRAHQVRVVDRIRASAIDLDMSLIAFLAVEGLKALDLFEADPLTTEERNRVLDGLVDRLDGG